MNEPPNPEVAVFAAAVELAAAQRAAYLDQACAGDPSLRAQVEALLRVHDEADHFFEVLAPVARPETGDGTLADSGDVVRLAGILSEKVGDRIGRYKLLQQIGEGGCGVVYMAEQEEPVRRRVALKVIKLGMDTKSVVARFEAERQALALMDHPNIAKVLDAGATETGRPYFVMELVRGVKITDYCDQNNLSTVARLKLFVFVCQAIQHAHQKGIIHRDIKPSNILVTVNDDVAVAKVIDFGIAKATQGRLTDRTLFTAFEQFLGTPAYMSPEQAVMTSLDIDTRSDIYSLGVLLYELLTSRTPFDSKELLQAGLDEIRRTIREEEPARPSTRLSTMLGADLSLIAKHRKAEPPNLIHLLRGDLDWIVMKAIEKDRARRYETANGLTSDIQRHLNNEPVVACPPSKVYRLRKWVQRHTLAFAAASAVIVSLAIGLGFSMWSLAREKQARRDAEAARANEAVLRQKAEGREKIAWVQDLMDKGHFADAEKALSQIPDSIVRKESRETASILSDLADWDIPENRWQEAAGHLGVLVDIQDAKGNFDQEWDSKTGVYLKYAPLLIEVGNQSGYARFRTLALSRYGKSGNPPVAERVLMSCLLAPANTSQLAVLGPMADLAVQTDPSNQRFSTWAYAAAALLYYRQGSYARAVEWGRKCVENPSPSPPVHPRVRVIMAMAHYRLNQLQQSKIELAQSREIIESKFRGRLAIGDWPTTGNCFDWIIDRILLHEAEATIEGTLNRGGESK